MLLLDLLDRWPISAWVNPELAWSLSVEVDPVRPVPGSSNLDEVQYSVRGGVLHRLVKFIDTDSIEGIQFDRWVGECEQTIPEDFPVAVLRFEPHNNTIVSNSAEQIAVLPVNKGGLVCNRSQGHEHSIPTIEAGCLSGKVASDLK